jgi:hypothetical protein
MLRGHCTTMLSDGRCQTNRGRCAQRDVVIRKQQPMPRGPATRPMRSNVCACNLSDDEMAFQIEVVSNLVVNSAELLQHPHTSRPLHRSFSSSKRLMRILRPAVETATDLVPIRDSNFIHRRRIEPKTTGGDDPRSAIFLPHPNATAIVGSRASARPVSCGSQRPISRQTGSTRTGRSRD